MEIPEKKKEILSAASVCFARFGYEKTTLDDIGKLVNLNKASLYHYYKNKESIFTEVIFAETEEYIGALQDKITSVKGWKEKILTYLHERLKYLSHVVNLHNLTVGTLRKVQPVFEKLYQIIFEKEVSYIESILKENIERGNIILRDTERVSRSILNISDAIKLKFLHNTEVHLGSNINYTEIIDEVKFSISLVLKGLEKTENDV